MSASDYWRNNTSLVHITPAGVRFPERGLYEALQSVCVGSVAEYGCGDGRLSPAFEDYYGYDINPAALDAARSANPGKEYGEIWRPGDTSLAYTVLLHIDDESIEAACDDLKLSPRVVVGEITGRKWRRPGDPPVFNREVDEYAELFGVYPEIIEVPYPRYRCNLSLMVFE